MYSIAWFTFFSKTCNEHISYAEFPSKWASFFAFVNDRIVSPMEFHTNSPYILKIPQHSPSPSLFPSLLLHSTTPLKQVYTCFHLEACVFSPSMGGGFSKASTTTSRSLPPKVSDVSHHFEQLGIHLPMSSLGRGSHTHNSQTGHFLWEVWIVCWNVGDIQPNVTCSTLGLGLAPGQVAPKVFLIHLINLNLSGSCNYKSLS